MAERCQTDSGLTRVVPPKYPIKKVRGAQKAMRVRKTEAIVRKSITLSTFSSFLLIAPSILLSVSAVKHPSHCLNDTDNIIRAYRLTGGKGAKHCRGNRRWYGKHSGHDNASFHNGTGHSPDKPQSRADSNGNFQSPSDLIVLSFFDFVWISVFNINHDLSPMLPSAESVTFVLFSKFKSLTVILPGIL